MTDNIKDAVHHIVRNSIDAVAESDAKYATLLAFVRSLTKRSCCNVCECAPCDATDILKELGEYE